MVNRRLNKPKRWQEVEFIGRQSIVRKYKPREWVTIYQKSGLSLQINPTYYDFRLWIFSKYGNVGIDLDRDWARHLIKAIAIHRVLISNVPSHEDTFRAPSNVHFYPRFTEGERAYLTRQV